MALLPLEENRDVKTDNRLQTNFLRFLIHNLVKIFEVFVNLSIITAALLLGVVLVRNHLLSNSTAHTLFHSQAPTEIKVSLPDVDWAKNRRTLLLALSSTCHYCSESAPFYQQIAEQRGNTHIIAIFPESVSDSKEYLSNLGVSVDEIKQLSLDSLEVRGTPTLMLVNNAGLVTDMWIGKLPPSEETEVLNRLHSNPSSK